MGSEMSEAARLVVLPRRGLSRDESARYVGVGTTKFDEMVSDRRMPSPRRVDGRVIWDIRELDDAFDNLPHQLAQNAWDGVR
jgi:predicted DNA-binding transcriptional regulator AlpA